MVLRSARPLRHSERWMRDGLTVCHVPAYAVSMDADMTESRGLLASAKSHGIRLTYTHLIVRAAALALAQNPDLHQMIGGNRVFYPEQVDIGLSIGSDTAAAPVLVIENSGVKTLPEIAGEIVERTPAVKEADRTMMQMLDRWGFVIPFGFMRRALLRTLFRNVHFRRKGSGTFQVSILNGVDQCSSPVFSASGALTVGSVRDKPVAINGRSAVRPTVTLTCCADHRVWDGRAALVFLDSVRNVLESGSLTAEMGWARLDQRNLDLGRFAGAQKEDTVQESSEDLYAISRIFAAESKPLTPTAPTL